MAIVTGSGSRGDVLGNGQATAILFAREGAKVMLVDSNQENLGRTRQSIESEEG
ncbi:MAG TPA: 3-oxoacyl-ACP reductase, partial [Dehalococcoidia bacterium]|nr:3-oxoacyl-ACP reductase [Dehalococcoidia bacterium]